MTLTILIQEVDQEPAAEQAPLFCHLDYVILTNTVLQIDILRKGGEGKNQHHPKFFVRYRNLQAICTTPTRAPILMRPTRGEPLLKTNLLWRYLLERLNPADGDAKASSL